jgi:hypothetical protein
MYVTASACIGWTANTRAVRKGRNRCGGGGFQFRGDEEPREEVDQHGVAQMQGDVEEVKAKQPIGRVVDKIGELQEGSDTAAEQISPPCGEGVDRRVIHDRIIVIKLENPDERIGIGKYNGKPEKPDLDPVVRPIP